LLCTAGAIAGNLATVGSGLHPFVRFQQSFSRLGIVRAGPLLRSAYRKRSNVIARSAQPFPAVERKKTRFTVSFRKTVGKPTKKWRQIKQVEP